MHTVVKIPFLLTLFCRMSFFATSSSDSKSASNSAFFDTILHFCHKLFYIILAHFTNFEVKSGQNGSKNEKRTL
jgi:hypothetical protein